MTEIVTAPGYSRPSYRPKTLRVLAHKIADKAIALDLHAIGAAGHSGLVLAGAVSVLSGLPVFAARKNGEERLTHGGNLTSGVAPRGPVARWAFLDDFVDSGETLRTVAGRLYQDRLVQRPVPDAILVYRGGFNAVRVNHYWATYTDRDFDWASVDGARVPVLSFDSEYDDE